MACARCAFYPRHSPLVARSNPVAIQIRHAQRQRHSRATGTNACHGRRTGTFEYYWHLSLTGGIKVGVTRSTQIPVRWIDQGAVLAVLIARTPYRQLAGAIEVDLKRTLADKTDYRKMLQQVAPDPGALLAARDKAMNDIAPELKAYMLHAEEPRTLSYPMKETLPKVTSVTFEKLPEITGTLLGIKGQYLLWKDGRVFNVRNHTGYHAEIE